VPSRFNGLHPDLVPYADALYQWAEARGLHPRITSVRRTTQQQAVLYQRYLRGQSTFPAAPPGRSLHERGLAFDMVTDDKGRSAGAVWNDAGGHWSPNDWVHFEYRA
jgi:LAS superfamily LD-carboxypeptidase LdcB